MIDSKFIFLAGRHRSGTSLLHEIIRDHTAVSGFSQTGVPQDEGQHLQSVYNPARVYGGPGKYIFHKSSYMDQDHELATENSARMIMEQWEKYYDLSCDYLIEKSPPNIIRTTFLQSVFPNSKFVVILRHPLAVAYATQKWSKTSVRSLVEHTLKGYEIFIDDMPHLDQVYVTRYEDFVCRPQEEIDRVYRFLRLEPIPIQHKVRPEVNDKYFSMWRRNRKSLWKRLQFPVSTRLEKRTNRFGYSLEQPEELLSVPFAGAQEKQE